MGLRHPGDQGSPWAPWDPWGPASPGAPGDSGQKTDDDDCALNHGEKRRGKRVLMEKDEKITDYAVWKFSDS